MKSHDQKILFVSNKIEPFLHHRSYLLLFSKQSGFSPTLMAGYDDLKKADCDSIEIGSQSFGFIPLNMRSSKLDLIGNIRIFVMVFLFLLREKPSVVHFVAIKPYLFGGLASRFAKFFGWKGAVVVTVPGLGRLFPQKQKLQSDDRFSFVILKVLLRIAMKHATVFFETLSDVNTWLHHGLVDPRQTRLTNGTGIDFNTYRMPSVLNDKGKMRILFAGRLIKSKGLDVFLQIATELSAESNLEFCIAGDIDHSDPDSVSLEELQAIPSLKNLGFIEDMPGLLADTDIVVLASRYNEGVPRILIEAAACGCVLLATSFPGSQTLIIDGETGLFIKGETKDEQVSCCIEFIKSLQYGETSRRNLGTAASSHVRHNGFGITDVGEKFIEVYNKG